MLADTCSSLSAHALSVIKLLGRPFAGLSLDMLGLWSASREYAVQDLVSFALTAVVGLVIILVVFWFWDSWSKVREYYDPRLLC